MKISNIFNLHKSQAELDFIDIDIQEDTALFLDPFFLGLRNDKWSIEATKTIRSFFQTVLNLLRNNQIDEAKKLFDYLHEPNSTCLGMSVGTPRGRGVGATDTDDIFKSIASSQAMQTGLIEDLEDNILFIEGFGKDKLSDMTTNIIRSHLIEYTQKQCKLHGIVLTANMPSEFYWNRQSAQWEQKMVDSLIANGKKILLVPKGVVSYCKDYVPNKYYQHFVLNFMQNEHLRLNSALIQKRKDGTPFVTKKDLKEKYPFSKDFLADFTNRNPLVLQQFKGQTSTSSLTNKELTELDIPALIGSLKTKLTSIPPGTASATDYHRTITGIIELIFYPHLIYPDLEREIHDGRKRIDINFDNASETGIFHRLSNNMGIPCQYIMMECKNYSSDPVNPELDQLSGRFSPNRGKVGFLLCRTIDKFDLFIKRCQDTYRDDRGLIIPLSDKDIIQILDNYNNWNSNYIDQFLSDRIREITIN
ncbi:hypothetical protein [Aquimarina sp. 2201CG14-23]|uniref:hypothetical protein n=1 Tax=Aquimarina mycalae TaxID=3040073 RepID=UPI002477FBAA|nr:hypothetical protein [Aquimarina sp. 2201CG14-23]MDH7444801.1 hypothetical protein [Aquimarina sp. 2201CG14-23]